MLFRKQIKSVPDIRTKIGKVIRVDNGLLDIMTIGGSAPIKGIKSSGSTPNVGDAVLVSYYKNGEVVATPASSNGDSSSGSGTTIVAAPTYVNQSGSFVPGLGLETDGSGITNVVITPGRTQITGNGIDVKTTLLPSPTLAEKGHFFVASGAGTAGWSRRIYMADDFTLVIQNASLQPVITLDSLDGAEFTLPMTIGVSGGIWQGTGTFASPTTGLKIWNDTGLGRIAGYNTGVLQWYAGTDGRLYAGAGAVSIDSTGIKITTGGNLKLWMDTSGRLVSYLTGGPVKSTLDSSDLKFTMQFTGYHGVMWINDLTTTSLIGEDWDNGAFRLESTSPVHFTLTSDFATKNSIHFADANFYGATSGSIQMIAPAVAGTRVLTLPAATGTVALTSDITSAISGATGTIPKFTGTNAIGNSIITESSSQIGINGVLKLGSGFPRSGASFDVINSDTASIANVTGEAIEFQYNARWGNGYVNDGYSFQYDIWAYRVHNGTTIYSSTPASATGDDDGGGGVWYTVFISWNRVAEADGYLIRVKIDNYYGASNDYYFNTTTNYAHISNGDIYETGTSYVYGAPSTSTHTTTSTSDFYLTKVGDLNSTKKLFAANFPSLAVVGLNGLRLNGNTDYTLEIPTTSIMALGGLSFNTSVTAGIGQLIFPQGAGGGSAPGIRHVGGTTDGGLAMNDGILELWNNFSEYTTPVSGHLQGVFRFDTRSGYEAEGFLVGGKMPDGTGFSSIGINFNTGDVNLAYYGYGSVAVGVDVGTAGISGNGHFGVKYDFYAGRDIIVNSSGGMKIGTATTQKLGFWDATPIVQPTTGVGTASFTANSGTAVNDASTFDGYTLKQVVKALRNEGLLA